MKTRYLVVLVALLVALSAFSQTVNTYTAISGTVQPQNQVRGYFGSSSYYFISPNGMGNGCYYGSCPAWQFTNFPLSYALPDGTTASFTNFTGTANFTRESDVQIQGTASGVDSTGAPVSVQISWDWSAFCRSGRGGGCTKKFLGGTLAVTK